ncbi:hypothetical protein H6F98_11045 [Microcoleus sp. FACHB-SPT15]|nr:hypothetical protein [Microcoleus sp. FACHB-SPT15]MBD1805986.1 hypothetical protein [Microcoleus sp. FACHB-SPT15]
MSFIFFTENNACDAGCFGFGVDVSLSEIKNLSDRFQSYTSAIATCNI